jgi:hypothetical protein
MSPGNGDPVGSATRMRRRAESSERGPGETQRRIADLVGRSSAVGVTLGGASAPAIGVAIGSA